MRAVAKLSIPGQVPAVDIARVHGVDPERFRAALRKAQLPWHRLTEPWTVNRGSSEHADMERVLRELITN